MNLDTIEGNWNQLKGKLKAQWGKLSGNYVEVVDDKGGELSGEVEEDYAIAKDAADQQVDSLDERTKE